MILLDIILTEDKITEEAVKAIPNVRYRDRRNWPYYAVDVTPQQMVRVYFGKKGVEVEAFCYGQIIIMKGVKTMKDLLTLIRFLGGNKNKVV